MERIRNKLLARPPMEYRKTIGTQGEFAGFHTTDEYVIAVAYAVLRVIGHHTHETADGDKYYVDDYPVVVTLDMSGYKRLVDCDAHNFVLDNLETQLDQIVEEIEDPDDDDEIYDKIERFGDFIESELIDENSPENLISHEVFQHMNFPLTSLPTEDAIELVKHYIKTGEIDERSLIEATRQFRYDKDVDSSRIIEVDYIKPFALETYKWERKIDEEKWEGFDIIDPDDIYSGIFDYSITKEYKNPQMTFPLTKPRIEYHGTTYKLLKEAAPELNLPKPPSPPYRG